MRNFVLLAGLLAATPAWADMDQVPPVKDPLVVKECGQCHMAFQPAFLPAGAWNAMMDGLSDHFGDDASLPAAKAAVIRNYLVDNAGRGEAQPLRITERRWFAHEHRKAQRQVATPEVKSIANCPACHQGAEQGLFEDD